jgi:hypothetical protein
MTEADISATLESSDEPCPKGDPRCPGPDGVELPCFDCYREDTACPNHYLWCDAGSDRSPKTLTCYDCLIAE